MLRSNELKQLRADAMDKMQALDKLVGTSRSMTAEEQKQWDDFSNEIESLNTEIAAEEKREAFRLEQQRQQGQNRPAREPEGQKISRKYSLLQAIMGQARGKLTGLEAEMHQEAVTEARAKGLNIEGVGIPSVLIDMTGGAQKRDLTATGGSNGDQGGVSVATNLGEFIPILTPSLQVVGLGATVFDNLTGNLDFPRQATAGTTAWEGETDANAETSPTFEKITLSPNRLGAYIDFSKQLALQATSPGTERFVRSELERIIREALDTAAINGSGSGNQPTGILNVGSGLNTVAIGTNGGLPTWATIVDMESAVATDNALSGNLAYLTTPGIRGILKQREKASSTAQFIWPEGMELNGYRAETSTLVPSTLSKGTSGAILHAILFGDWSSLYIGQWGGIDLVVDPYTLSTSAMIRVVANSWWDIALRHNQSFAVCVDATTLVS